MNSSSSAARPVSQVRPVSHVLLGWMLNAVYLLTLLVASPWLVYARVRYGKYREGWAQKLLGRVPGQQDGLSCIWLHAVSVGEVNLLEPLLKRLEAEFPHARCVISTTTQTGYQLACRRYAPRTVFYCPLDFTWAIRSALRRLNPTMLVLAELELWPNLIRMARQRGVRVAVVNGRLSQHSARGYARVRWLARRILGGIDVLAVQNQTYADRFLKLGAEPSAVHVTGSLKFDGAETDRENPRTRQLARLWGVKDEDAVFLAGSTQDPEERLALQAFELLRDRFPRLKLILVPRHPERFEAVAQMLDEAGAAWQRRSDLESSNLARDEVRILLVDVVGELGAWWGTAKIAYVGGSMGPREGQNMIEPAAYGGAVSFGPRTRNFRDVVELLLDSDAAQVVTDGDALAAFVRRCLVDPGWAQTLGERARQLVARQLGATERTCDLLRPLLGAAAVTEPASGPARTNRTRRYRAPAESLGPHFRGGERRRRIG